MDVPHAPKRRDALGHNQALRAGAGRLGILGLRVWFSCLRLGAHRRGDARESAPPPRRMDGCPRPGKIGTFPSNELNELWNCAFQKRRSLLPTTVLRPSTDPLGALDDPAAGAYRRVAMIHYPKRYWGLPLAFRWFGSPFPRTIPFVALSVGLTTALQLAGEWKRTIVDAFGHPYPFQVYAFVIGFLVVLRTNHALARFMEARGAWSRCSPSGRTRRSCCRRSTASPGRRKENRRRAPVRRARAARRVGRLHRADRALAQPAARARAAAAAGRRGRAEPRRRAARGGKRRRPRAGGGRRRIRVAWRTSRRRRNADENETRAASSSAANQAASDRVVRVVLTGETGEAFAKRTSSRATYNLGGAFHQTAAVADAHQNRANLLSAFSLTEADYAWRACCAATPLAVVGGVDGAELAALRRLDCDRAYLAVADPGAHRRARGGCRGAARAAPCCRASTRRCRGRARV